MPLILRKNKFSHLFLAAALISASTNFFVSYEQWVRHKYSVLYLDWPIVGIAVLFVFIWWSIDRQESVDAKSEIISGGRNLECARNWCANNACRCLANLVLFNIATTSLLMIFNWRFINTRFGAEANYVCSLISFLAITVLYSGVRSFREFKVLFGFLPPKVSMLLYSSLSGGIVAGIAVFFVKTGVLRPYNKFVESFGGEHVAGAYFLILFAPFFEETILRGFLYKALRQDYSVPVSFCCIFGIVAYTHFSVMWILLWECLQFSL